VFQKQYWVVTIAGHAGAARKEHFIKSVYLTLSELFFDPDSLVLSGYKNRLFHRLAIT
jgi:hypothetical protein